MLIIDHKDSVFLIDFDKSNFLPREEFLFIVNTLKSLYLYSNGKCIASHEKIEEVLHWFEKYKIKYILTDIAKEQLIEIKRSYYKEFILFKNKIFDSNVLKPNKTPYNFQKDIIDWKIKRNVCLDACDSGTGKTFTSIAVLSQRFYNKDIDGAILIVPNGLQFQWQYLLLDYSNQFNEEDIVIITNDNKFQIFEKYTDKKIIIFSNTLLKDVILSYNSNYKFGKSAKKIKWDILNQDDIKIKWNKKNIALIIDEAHLFSNVDAIKTKCLLSIKNNFTYIEELTATPNITKFENIYSLMRILDKSIIPMSYNAFLLWLSKNYQIGKKYGYRYDKYAIACYDVEKIQYIKEKIKSVTIQVLKKDLEEMKTQKTIEPIYLQTHAIQQKLYKKIIEVELNRLYEEYDEITWKMLYNKFPYLLNVLDCPSYLKCFAFDNDEIINLLDTWKDEYDPKLQALDYLLQDIVEHQNNKIIISDSKPFILNLLFKRYSKYNPLIIHGSLQDEKDKDAERWDKVEKFNKDDKNKIFLLSNLTSSTGLNLQDKCSRILFYSMPSALAFWQMQDRTARITSRKDTFIQYFTYPQTIDNHRVFRVINRVEMGEKLTKKITQEELEKLVRGIV